MGRPLGGLDYEASAICEVVSEDSRPPKEHLEQIMKSEFIVKK